MNKKKPIVFLILKILAGIFLCVAIAGLILWITSFGNFEKPTFILGILMTCLGFFLAFSCCIVGFFPEMSKLSIKMTKHLQQAAQEDLTDIATTNAEIHTEAVKTTASAVKKAFDEVNKTYCKYCGAMIDEDSHFCKACGKEQ